MPCFTVTIFILQVEMQSVYMMYRLLNKTYCVGMLANSRIEAVEVEKIVNHDVVQKYKDVVPFIPAFILKFTVTFEKLEQLISILYISIHHCIDFLLN